MTESEYKEQSERLGRYRKAADRLSVITQKKADISNGVISIDCVSTNCDYGKQIDFEYLGEDFKKMLTDSVVSFLDSEIETIKKSMDDI